MNKEERMEKTRKEYTPKRWEIKKWINLENVEKVIKLRNTTSKTHLEISEEVGITVAQANQLIHSLLKRGIIQKRKRPSFNDELDLILKKICKKKNK